MHIRPAAPEDAETLLAIYAPYVTGRAVTFEEAVPTVSEFRARIERTLEKYPYLVAEEGGEVVGYAYAGPFRTRAAYRYAAELSVYVKEGCLGKGVGKALYDALLPLLARQNICVACACITALNENTAEDPYLDDGSIRFHTKMGFTLVGRHERCGFKFGRWYSMVWMERELRPREGMPGPFIPYPETEGEMNHER